MFTGAYPPGRGPASWAACSTCGQHGYSHAPGCEERPVLAPVAHSQRTEWWVRVRGVRIGLVSRMTETGSGRYVYRAQDHAGRRVPTSRSGLIWQRGRAVNAVVRAWREREAVPELVELDAPADPV